jgi:ribosomal protein S18 acetylase RimI-like enzyme
MHFQILDYQGTSEEDSEITLLLTRVFVEEGFTDKSDAETMFTPTEVRRRGDIILAKSIAGKLLGMIIFVPSTSPARQIADIDEAEIHLLAVHPEARGQGVASRLILLCEQRAISYGYSKMVLSTQQTMKQAHQVYKSQGYRRNSARDWSNTGTNKVFNVYEKALVNQSKDTL